MVLVQEAAGVRDLHWASLGPGLLSQLPTQLGPLPLLGVESVEPDLTQDHQVNSHLTIDNKTFFSMFRISLVNLKRATDEELRRSFSQNEVSCLEDVPAGPHNDHGKAHAVSGLVLKISVELRHSKAGLSEDGEETNRIHKPLVVKKEIHEDGAKNSDAQNELQIGEKVCPLPEIVWVKVSEVTALPLLRKELLVVYLHAEMNKSKHGEVHQDALDQERSLKVVPEPEDDPKSVGHQERQADIHRETLCCLLRLYLQVLWDVRHHTSKYHGQFTSYCQQLK